MPSIIELLPDKIINQIAAGEVIQRPASVVKELLENSLDAGSTEIHLVVRDAGKTLIQVVDNGKGMSPEDARMCFNRHATSKIRNVDDLYQLYTMGFRGEALASIAAISHVELKTRSSEHSIGNLISIEGSEIVSEEECQQAEGSKISVKNLFYNVPARRNFLKSDAVETRHIIDEFLRIVLANPEIAFTMHHNNSEVYHLRSANLRQRVVAVFGNHYNERLVPVEEDTDYVKVNGFIGKPESAKRTRGEQFFFLNGRYIKNAYLNHAVVSAYGNLFQDKTYPLYVLNINIDPSAIDVNVHPTKQEVKFEDEKSVYMIVQAAVKHGLAQYSVMPSIDFDQEASFKDFEAFKHVFAATVSDPQPQKGGYTDSFRKKSAEAWQKIYDPDDSKQEIVTVPSKWNDQPELPMKDHQESSSFSPVQVHRSFILTQIKSGLILIQQNHAHQRILYEKYQDSFERNCACQQLLFPVKLQLNNNDAVLLTEMLDDIRLLGFDITVDNGQFSIKGVPVDLINENPEKILENMLEQFKWNADHQRIDQRDNLARSLARHTAIPNGKVLTTETMEALIDQLFGCNEPQCTAYGQPTFIQYSLENLREQFGIE